VTRLRWLATKLTALLALTLLLTTAYALLISWWLGPLDRSTGDRVQPGIFDQQGLVPVGYALFALALGIAAGAILRKTMPAMAATLVGFVGLHAVPQFSVGSVCPATRASTRASLDECVRAHGFLNTDVFQPGSRFWLFQGIQAAIFLGLAVVLLAVAVWWVRRRLA
jgi:hypothetical protein